MATVRGNDVDSEGVGLRSDDIDAVCNMESISLNFSANNMWEICKNSICNKASQIHRQTSGTNWCWPCYHRTRDTARALAIA
jgi:hypothetical protein